MVFSNFFNIFAIFLECSITGREETQRSLFLPFLSFVVFPDLFWLETKLWRYFLNFWIFLLFFFGIFYDGSCRNIAERFFLFSLFLGLSQPILALKESLMVFFKFYCYFFGIFYYGSGRATSEQFFYFLSLAGFPYLFWLVKLLRWCFLIFWIFLLFFWNFLLRAG